MNGRLRPIAANFGTVRGFQHLAVRAASQPLVEVSDGFGLTQATRSVTKKDGQESRDWDV
jgi:hypothetical protein